MNTIISRGFSERNISVVNHDLHFDRSIHVSIDSHQSLAFEVTFSPFQP